jgi:hypothetical protein
MRSSALLRLWPLVLAIAIARLYVFGMLYLFFLHTDLRTSRDEFLLLREGQTREEREAEIRASFWERLAPFDGQFYLDIAENGYRTISESPRGKVENYAFLPLLPLTLASLRAVFPQAYLPLGIALNLFLAVAGTVALWRLAEKCGAWPFLSISVLLAFPSAPFQYVLYTEGMFLGFSALALLFAMEKRPWWTLFFALLAGLSRPQGILLALPVFIELVLPALRRGGMRAALGPLLAACAPLAGFLVLGVVSHRDTGSPFSFLSVQGNWGRDFEATGILKAIASVFDYAGPPMDLLGLLVGLGCLPLIWRRLPLSLALYGSALVLMPLATGSILSFGRFLSVSLPHLLALSILLEERPRAMRFLAVAAFGALQLLLARGLMGWHFVG